MEMIEGNVFRNFFVEHKKAGKGEGVKIYKNFLVEHIKSYQEAWKEEENVKYFGHFNLPGRDYVNILLYRTHQVLSGEKYLENTCLASVARWLLSFVLMGCKWIPY